MLTRPSVRFVAGQNPQHFICRIPLEAYAPVANPQPQFRWMHVRQVANVTHPLLGQTLDRCRHPSSHVRSELASVLEGSRHPLNTPCHAMPSFRLASGSADHSNRLWDMSTGVELATLNGHTNAVLSVAFSPGGHRLASGSADHSIRLWDVSTGSELTTLTGHTGSVYSVAFSPDGQRLASGSEDQGIRLWDVSTGAELAVLTGHTSDVTSVAFSPDGHRLASGSRARSF